jgi:hypothetical protein
VQYLALIHADEDEWDSLNDGDRETIYARYMELAQDEKVVGGAELESSKTATTVRVRNGERLVTDGPYAEVREALGGYFIFECDSIDEACRLAAKIPAAERGAIEIRPVHSEEAS